MKKLLITAIGAAIAFGAYADSMRFENEQDGDKTISTLPGGNSYWSEPAGSTNTYTVGAAGTVSAPLSIASESVSPQKALSVKTTFGKPLSLNAVSGGAVTNINEGLYFDSLVKFTVCEDTPNESYDGAKIIMWLQETYDGNENVTGTNLMVRAGYLSFAGNAVTAVPTNYVCALPSGFNADAWHRVTIKAIADITNARQVPGFAIYLDQNGSTPTSDVNAPAAKWDGTFPVAELTEAADLLNQGNALFPSLDQTTGNKSTLQSASFDGTGAITDLIFTDDGPAFAKDLVSDKATIVNDATGNEIDGSPFKSLAAAVAAVNGQTSGTYTFTLSKGMVLDEPLSFASQANVILDFAGNVLTNESNSAAAISNTGNLTITNSTSNVGGVYCLDDGAALEFITGGLAIYGGIFAGEVILDAGADVYGGSYEDDTNVQDYLAEGKVISEIGATYPGLYDVVDEPVIARIGDKTYPSLAAAVAAATAGQTVVVLADCEVTEPITFTEGITVSNDFTVSINTYYALRIANGTTTPVTFGGTGSYVWTGGSGSPILVGCNEKKKANAAQGDPDGIQNFYQGSFVLDGVTLTSTDATAKAGNLVKLEDGTFVLNGGTINGGTRGIKADSEGNNATCVLTVNGGTIVNTNSAAIAASTAGSGSSTVTVNAGTFTGAITGAGMVTIPGNSTAQFDRDQTAFCATGYATTLSGGWYVVGLANYTINYLNEDGTAFTDWAEYVPTTSYTIEDAVTLPTSSDVQLGLGVEFGGWTNETGTVTGWAAGEKTGDVTVYAKLNPIVPSGLDPASGTTNVTVTAASAADAITAAKSAITVPTGSGATAADYANLFNYSATPGSESGTFNVAITGIKDEVVAAVNADAIGVFSGDTSVLIPAGLYYRVTPSTALPISGTPATGLSTGSITVTKPGETQGFIKVELSSASF